MSYEKGLHIIALPALFWAAQACLLSSVCHAQTTSESILKKYFGLGLPLVCICTTDGRDPTSARIDHPEGNYIGTSITDVVPKEARMQIYRADTLWYDSGEFQEDKSGIVIRHRGNTSAALYSNKPFKLSLQKKADLIEDGEDDITDRRSKDWVLLNCSFSLRSHFISLLAGMIGMEYSPRVEYVNVIVNNNYRGIYILSENVKRDADCRIDVDREEGYIIELNAYFWNEPFSIRSALTGVLEWTLKYPKPENLTEEREAGIRGDIERLEASVKGADYPEVIDVRSVARWILLHDLLGTYDSGGSNIFVARKDRRPASLMRMPTGWDMDSSMRYPDQWSRTHTEKGIFIYHLFANKQCQDFVEVYLDEWKRVCEAGVMERMAQACAEFPSTPQGQGLTLSYPLHAKRWGFSAFDVGEMSAQIRDWFTERPSNLERLMTGLADGMTEIEAAERADTRKVILGGHLCIVRGGETYSVDGKRVR